jgi:hypothetical protein
MLHPVKPVCSAAIFEEFLPVLLEDSLSIAPLRDFSVAPAAGAAEMPNALLDTEADQLCDARKYERAKSR